MKELWKHQLDGISFALELDQLYGTYANPDVGYFYEQGTGKTRTLIEVLRRRYAHEGRLKKTLILCPVIVCENWKREFGEYSKIDFKDIVVLKGPGKKRVQDLLKSVGPDLSGNKIIVTNFEAVEIKDLYALLLKWAPEILVCDESQKLKNPTGIRSRAVVGLGDSTQSNFILTGTPILNSPMDLYMQFRILDRGKTFGRNFFAFRNEYFYDANAGFKGRQGYFPRWEPRPEAFVRMQDAIKRRSLRVLAKDCQDLPPLIRQLHPVEMSPVQAKAYKEMLNEYVTFIDAQSGPAAVVAQLAVTKALRLQQIVSGFVKDDDGGIHRFPNPRLDALEELLLDITPNNKVIVWANFHENYTMIAELCTKLAIPYREIHGGITHAQREVAMDEFRTDPSVKVMIANQGAGGVGINLVEAKYAVYYSKGFKLEDDLQSRKRNHRGGSEIHDRVIQIDLVCPGTIDELVLESLENKQKVSDVILTWKDKLRDQSKA